MKKVLVTGSSGYIGQHLVKILQGSGLYTVYGMDNKVAFNDYLKRKNFFQHDIRYPIPTYAMAMGDWQIGRAHV